jgi:hypothetical protein
MLVLVALLVLAPAAPASAYWRGSFWVGLGTGLLVTAPFWYGPSSVYYYPSPYPYSPYPYSSPYPVYAYPPASSPPPAYAPPAYTPPAYVPPSSPTTPTPSPLSPAPPAEGAPSASAQNCETVWIEGHYEVHVSASGQATTVWVPGASRQICQ